eukprot:Tbor_TRINITY_DN4469_c0_g1::TRINITY_DN4469_c0_g1_i2::g.8076::m.8076
MLHGSPRPIIGMVSSCLPSGVFSPNPHQTYIIKDNMRHYVSEVGNTFVIPESSNAVDNVTNMERCDPKARSWTPQQLAFRHLMSALRSAFYHDRSRLFWARHRVRVDYYKYSKTTDDRDKKVLLDVSNEIAVFIEQYMKVSIRRIQEHNDTMMSLSVPDAKKYREAYLLRETQHESWCKQKIRSILDRRPPPPYPYC